MNFLKTHKIGVLLFLIVLLAFALRFYQINNVPVSLYWDEVSSTYNAYSIAMTGRDEFGTAFPAFFRAFEDYKAPGNIYLTALFIRFLGLSEFSARFTSALLGTATVFLSYFFVKSLIELFRKERPVKMYENPKALGLLTAFLLSISPWHIQFSRTGFEANVGLFFVVLAGLVFFLSMQRKSWKTFLLSMLLFILSLPFYRSLWVFVPFVVSGFLVIFRNEIFSGKNKWKNSISVVIFLVLFASYLPLMISKEGMTRTRQVNIVSNSREQVYDAAKKQNDSGNSILSKVFYNRRLVYVEVAITNYFSHFSPQFLFLTGDGNGRHGVFGMGVLYVWEAPFLLIGLWYVLKQKKLRSVVLLWILIAPIPAAVSIPSPHALRSLNMLPMPQLLTAFGVLIAYQFFSKRYRSWFVVVLSICVLVFFARYVYLYYVVTAKAVSSEWGDGYKQLVSYTTKHEGEYEKIVVSGHYWQPYIYFLFYKQYDPALFQKSGSKKGFGKYVFGGTSWDREGKELGDVDLRNLTDGEKALIALSPLEYGKQKIKKEPLIYIRNHNDEIVFIVFSLE